MFLSSYNPIFLNDAAPYQDIYSEAIWICLTVLLCNSYFGGWHLPAYLGFLTPGFRPNQQDVAKSPKQPSAGHLRPKVHFFPMFIAVVAKMMICVTTFLFCFFYYHAGWICTLGPSLGLQPFRIDR